MAMRSVVPCVICLLSGIGLGWLASSYSTPRAIAGQVDRSGESMVVSGPVSVEFNPKTKMPVVSEALYVLDYATGRLMATMPGYVKTVEGERVLNAFTVRDLVADFRPPRGSTPRFMMTLGNFGNMGIDATGNGWAPLFVFETTTGQVATYRVTPGPMRAGGEQPPAFDLVELKKLP